jgi:hypothetical protein
LICQLIKKSSWCVTDEPDESNLEAYLHGVFTDKTVALEVASQYLPPWYDRQHMSKEELFAAAQKFVVQVDLDQSYSSIMRVAYKP